jgi:Fe-S-cluster-containing dehydrogenase component/DMSO reductase anchor subunit
MIRSPSLNVVMPQLGSATQRARMPLVDALLAEQEVLSAVDVFARAHDQGALPEGEKLYKHLLPARAPGPGQQYAFSVDLDACTGCKACVVGCHNMNGLDEQEVWRTVGLLHGGSAQVPAQQTVTTSCHHCVDPGCMKGCPVKAYEKDPVTGIVKHLDDQCIGCQYCTLMCPYDAPKYSAERGIVRKCDMCSDRLASGEAPACVQACPNGAISISVIDQAQAVQASEAGAFLPGAPAPDHTIPTTVYRSARDLPHNFLPADFYTVTPGHAHLPLVVMLLLTQLSVGAFLTNVVLGALFGARVGAQSLMQAIVGLGVAALALGAATLHLGRPQFAFRAVLGFGTSWMSREIVAFGLFANVAALYAVSLVPPLAFLPPLALQLLELIRPLRSHLELAAAGMGLLGVSCSALIYAATKRSQWSLAPTAIKFFGTTVVLGGAAVLVMDAATGASTVSGTVRLFLLRAVLGVAALKVLYEAGVLRHLGGRQHTTAKRIALLMVGELRAFTAVRFAAGAAAVGVGVALHQRLLGDAPPGLALPLGLFALLGLGESLERAMFFTAAPPSRMPGTPS